MLNTNRHLEWWKTDEFMWTLRKLCFYSFQCNSNEKLNQQIRWHSSFNFIVCVLLGSSSFMHCFTNNNRVTTFYKVANE